MSRLVHSGPCRCGEHRRGPSPRQDSPSGVLNFATPNSRAHEETARDVLKAIGLPLAPVVLLDSPHKRSIPATIPRRKLKGFGIGCVQNCTWAHLHLCTRGWHEHEQPGRALPLVRFTTERDLEDELHRA
jgi:hypothetical protein